MTLQDDHNNMRLETLYPPFQINARIFLEKASNALLGRILVIDSALRTFDEQAQIYAQGRTLPGEIISNSPPGESFHNYGLAFDCMVFMPDAITEDDSQYKLLADIANSCGIHSGYNWPAPLTDEDHFERNYGLGWQELLSIYNATGGLPGVWRYLDSIKEMV